jgi:hypothetical protein
MIIAGNVKGSLAIPSFYDNFDKDQSVISNSELQAKLEQLISVL